MREFEKIDDIPLPYMEPVLNIRPNFRGVIYPLDKDIENLVRVLTGLGLTTTMSCEGHLDPPNIDYKRSRYPWVSIEELRRGRPRTYQKDILIYKWVEAELTQYNLTHPINWRIFNNERFNGRLFPHSGLRTIEKAKDKQELLNLQEGADDLARYLFDKYLRVSRPAE